MRFATGQTPEWAGKPKASTLDTDADFQNLKALILSGKMEPAGAGLYVDEVEDGNRLGAKNPARMVRDHLNRLIKDNGLEHRYDITCRRTAQDGVWGVWVRLTA